MARAKRSQLIDLIRDLRRAVVIEASGGEGDPHITWTVCVLSRADCVLAAETAITVTPADKGDPK